MAGRRGDSHRLIRWLWTSRRLDARLARAALLPAAGLWRAGMGVRALTFRRGWRPTFSLPLPAVAVGNLTVGGSGKTPIASWIARHYAAAGARPGILLRGYGSDEVLVHRHDVPEAVVVADPDRVAGAARAAREGAEVLVLDDAFQRVDVRRDLNILVVSAETTRAVRWPLPAGPWREGWHAMSRADFVIVTRKRASREAAASLVAAIRVEVDVPIAVVHLGLHHLEGLVSGTRRQLEDLRGRRVVAASAIGDPDAFVAQVKGSGAQVQVATWGDHHDFRDEDVAWLARAARKADQVVITAKDAVKLRNRWPASAPEPMVAILDVRFESGGDDLVAALDALLPPGRRSQ